MSAATARTSDIAQTQAKEEKSTIMNGIKKVFHRNSTTSISSDDEQHLSSAGNSPTQRKFSGSESSDARTSVDSREPSSPRKGSIAAMTTKASVAPDNKVGKGRSEHVATMNGEDRHTHGHSLPKNGNVDLTQGKVTQTVEHLAGLTNKTHHTHQIEEVTRNRTLERHQHHIQVHHQPIKHETHEAEKAQTRSHPITNISETHASTDKDAALLASVVNSHGFKNQDTRAPVQHQIVDQGEQLSEQIHHHIHNVVIPLITHDSHEHHRIRTTIPTHHVVHEAPIIHQATTLEPVSQKDFLARGGSLTSSKKSIEEAKLLHDGTCTRKVDGVAEKLAKEMNLSPVGGSAVPVAKAQAV